MIAARLCYVIRRAWGKALMDNRDERHGPWSPLPGRTGITL